MTFRPRPIWRFGLPAALVVSLISAIVQHEWRTVPGVFLLYGVFAAMAWRWRIDLTPSTVRVTRITTSEFDRAHLAASVEQVSWRGIMRHLMLTDAMVPRRRVALLVVWWGDWRRLADELDADLEHQWH